MHRICEWTYRVWQAGEYKEQQLRYLIAPSVTLTTPAYFINRMKGEIMTPDYSKTTSKSFETVVREVEEAAMKRSFRTLHIHDVQATLAEKDFDIPPYSILEVCNSGFAYKAIQAYSPIGMMLPCRIVVYAEGDATRVTLFRPSLMSEILPDADLGSLPMDVEQTLIEVVDEVTA